MRKGVGSPRQSKLWGVPAGFSGAANKYLGAFCYFWKVQMYRDKKLQTYRKALGRLSLKQNKTIKLSGTGLEERKQFPRVKFPKISFKRVYTLTHTYM